MALNRVPREFRPTAPKLKNFASAAFLGVLFVIIAPEIAAQPTTWTMVGLSGTLCLVVGGFWLQLRGRWPGKPVMKVDKRGMTYIRWGRASSLAWSEIVAMPVDFTLDRMSFVPHEGKPIHMRPDMFAEDGTDWLGVIEDYWNPPNGRRSGVK